MAPLTVAEIQAQLAALQNQLPTAIQMATTPVIVGDTVEPGYTTTEFWGTVAVDVMALVAVVHPGFSAPPELAQAFSLIAAGAAHGLYSLGRSLRKKG